MQWHGKAIGGLVGALLGPVGSLLGMWIGHRWDRLFFEVTFEVMGRIAKADGRVSEDEVQVARRIMRRMRLSEASVQSAIEHFTRGKSPKYPLEDRLAALVGQIGTGSDRAREFLQIQLASVLGAGTVGEVKREMLWRVARVLGITRVELDQLEAHVRGGAARPTAESLAEAYRVLGVDRSASNDEVKTAYRRLMNEHHPDKLVARGLPKSMIDVAGQKTHEVRTAYEQIKTQRGFK
jgi:DnaJ like chaperone protein